MALPSHQRRKSDRPDELLDAALTLFVEHGFAATRMEDVAQRAGVSKGTVYLYWSSKEDLLRAVIQRFLTAQLDAGEVALRSHQGTFVELLRVTYADWWIEVIDSPAAGVFKLMLAEARNFPEVAAFYAREVSERGERMVREALERGISRGEIRPVDVEAAVFSLLLPMVMLCVHKHAIAVCVPDGPMQDAPRLVRAHIDLLLQGLLPPQGAPKMPDFSAPARAPGSA